MSGLVIHDDGKFAVEATGQMELTADQRNKMSRLVRSQSDSITAQAFIKAKIAKTKAELMNNPKYIELLRLQEQLKMLGRITSRASIVLEAETAEIFQSNGVADPANYFAALLPDPVLTSEKKQRGRPRKQLTAGGAQ